MKGALVIRKLAILVLLSASVMIGAVTPRVEATSVAWAGFYAHAGFPFEAITVTPDPAGNTAHLHVERRDSCHGDQTITSGVFDPELGQAPSTEFSVTPTLSDAYLSPRTVQLDCGSTVIAAQWHHTASANFSPSTGGPFGVFRFVEATDEFDNVTYDAYLGLGAERNVDI